MLPVLLLFILGIMDTGRFLWTYTTLSRAVQAAARCAAVNTTKCSTDAQIQSSAVAEAWGLSVNPSNFVVTRPLCGVQVQTAYNFTFTIPGFYAVPLGTIALNARACYSTGA